MSDDAPQPSFYGSFSTFFASFTRLVDENIRIVQYGVYCAGAAGVVLVLHSARAFTKFKHINDIPKEFISKHMRLHGRVHWVGVELPSPTHPPAHPQLLLHSATQPSTQQSPSPTSTHLADQQKLKQAEAASSLTNQCLNDKKGGRSLSEDNRGIYDGAGELHPWEDGIDPDVARIHYEEEVRPLFLKVEHTPAIPLFHKSSSDLLCLQLADVEVSSGGVAKVRDTLVGRSAWFTLISHNTEEDVLVSFIKPAKMFSRSVNETVLREGLGLAGPMDLDLHGDPLYCRRYMALIKAQQYAEKKQLGLWKIPDHQQTGVLRRVWLKLRAFLGRKQK